jgi:hypothetical protein
VTAPAGLDGPPPMDVISIEQRRRSTAAPPALPMPDAPAVAYWAPVVQRAHSLGAATVLVEQLVQLRVPIERGISQSAGYANLRRPGGPPDVHVSDVFARPDLITISLAASPAGRIPVITCGSRVDFEHVVRAIVHRNEPAPVPASMGACLITGYVNWTRLHAVADGQSASTDAVGASVRDSLIILSSGAYSAVSSEDMSMTEAAWIDTSLQLRRQHELAHYLCKRALGEMKNALLDELAADYSAITTVRGRFDGRWLRRFMGVEHFPRFRSGGRLSNYGASARRSAAESKELERLVVVASDALQRFDERRLDVEPSSAVEVDVSLATLAIMRTGLETLTAPNGAEQLLDEWLALRSRR